MGWGLKRGLGVEKKALSCFPYVPLEINLKVLDVTTSFLKTNVVIHMRHLHDNLFSRYGIREIKTSFLIHYECQAHASTYFSRGFSFRLGTFIPIPLNSVRAEEKAVV